MLRRCRGKCATFGDTIFRFLQVRGLVVAAPPRYKKQSWHKQDDWHEIVEETHEQLNSTSCRTRHWHRTIRTTIKSTALRKPVLRACYEKSTCYAAIDHVPGSRRLCTQAAGINRIPETALRALQELFLGDAERVEKEIQWVKDKQLFDDEESRSLADLIESRLRNIKSLRNLSDGHLMEWLLGPCHTIEAAELELRWLREHVELQMSESEVSQRHEHLEQLCKSRHAGNPLQYLLGSEYFGNIKLLCREGVLVPRQDTADHVMHLLHRLKHGKGLLPKKIRVLDLCCGSGCMGLLMAHSFPYEEAKQRGNERLEIYGIDYADKAIDLAEANRQQLLESVRGSDDTLLTAIQTLRAMKFIQVDLLGPEIVSSIQRLCGERSFDIILANPPYIEAEKFETEVSLSVRLSEPVDALIPQVPAVRGATQADVFYQQIMHIATALDIKVVLMEVGSLAQGQRQLDLFHTPPNFNEKSDSSSVQNWARPRTNFGLDQTIDAETSEQMQSRYGSRGWVVYSYKMDAAGWVGPSEARIAPDGDHYAV